MSRTRPDRVRRARVAAGALRVTERVTIDGSQVWADVDADASTQ
jgi:hypothetical protein